MPKPTHEPEDDATNRHLIGNLKVASRENAEVEAKTAFLVYRSQLETEHQLLSVRREDVLRMVNGAWNVTRCTIVLDANACSTRTSASFSSGRSDQPNSQGRARFTSLEPFP